MFIGKIGIFSLVERYVFRIGKCCSSFFLRGERLALPLPLIQERTSYEERESCNDDERHNVLVRLKEEEPDDRDQDAGDTRARHVPVCQYKQQDQDNCGDGVDEVAQQPLSERSRHLKDIQPHEEEECYEQDEDDARCPVEEGFHRGVYRIYYYLRIGKSFLFKLVSPSFKYIQNLSTICHALFIHSSRSFHDMYGVLPCL